MGALVEHGLCSREALPKWPWHLACDEYFKQWDFLCAFDLMCLLGQGQKPEALSILTKGKASLEFSATERKDLVSLDSDKAVLCPFQALHRERQELAAVLKEPE